MKNHVKKILAAVTVVILSVLSMSIMVFAEAASEATGAADNAPASGGGFSSLWIIVAYIAFFVLIGYFLIFRPNKKRKKQEEELRSSIILGDEVTTIGGIVGRVVNIKDDNITIETSLDKTLMEFKNWAIREVKKPITDDEPSDK